MFLNECNMNAKGDVLKCLALSVQNTTDIEFAVTEDKENQKIFTFQKLEPGNIWHFYLKIINAQILKYSRLLTVGALK